MFQSRNLETFIVYILLSHAFAEVITITRTRSGCPAISNGVSNSNAPSSFASIWTSTAPGPSSSAPNNGSSQPTLVPVPQTGGNPADFDNLAPGNSSMMYYCNGGSSASCDNLMVQLNATFAFPTVILEHSNYISGVAWQPTQLTIIFNSPGAYNFVKQTWNLPPTDIVRRDIQAPFVIATTARPGDQQRDYFLVNKVHYNDDGLLVVAYGSELQFNNSVSDLGIIWGSYASANSSFSTFVGTPTSPIPKTVTATQLHTVPGQNVTLTESALATTIQTSVDLVSTTILTTISGSRVVFTTFLPTTTTAMSLIFTTNWLTSTLPAQVTTQLSYATLWETMVLTTTQPVQPSTVVSTATLIGTSVVTYTASGQITTSTQSVYSYSTSVLTITPAAKTVTTTQTTSVVSSSTITSVLPASTVTISALYPVYNTTTVVTTAPPQTITVVVTSTVAPSSASASGINTTSCGSLPSTTSSGMPIATCGSSFDANLDAQLGFYDFTANNGSQLATFAPGVNLTYGEVFGAQATNSTMRLRKRWGCCHWISHAISTVSHAVSSVVHSIPVVSQIATVYETAVSAVIGVVKLVVGQPVSPSVSFTVPINLGPSNNADSPWGPAYKFFDCSDECGAKEKANKDAVNKLLSDGSLLNTIKAATGATSPPEPGIRLFCVGCGVHGSFTASGSITVELYSGIKAAQVGFSGSLDAGVSLGLEALAVYSKELGRVRIIEVGIPGFSIPKVVTVGPELTLDIAAGIEIEAQGQVIAGIHYSLPNFAQTINFVDKSKSRSTGWIPQLTRTFNASGSLTAEAWVGLPIGIVVGIDLLDGKYSLTAGIVDTPSVNLHASYSVSYDLVNGVQSGSDTCSGIDWYIDLENKIEVVYPSNTLLLGQWDGPTLAKGCLLGKKPTAAATTNLLSSTSSTRISTISSMPSLSVYSSSSSSSSRAQSSSSFTMSRLSNSSSSSLSTSSITSISRSSSTSSSFTLSSSSVATGKPPSTDFTCAGTKGYTCLGSSVPGMGYCCSQFGYCGFSDAYCGSGCQSAFGCCGSNCAAVVSSASSSSSRSSSSTSSSAPTASVSMCAIPSTFWNCPSVAGNLGYYNGSYWRFSCVDVNGTIPTGPNLGTIASSSFQQCVQLCSTFPGCFNAFYGGGTCWYTGAQTHGETFSGAGYGAAVKATPLVSPGLNLTIEGSTSCPTSVRPLAQRTAIPDPVFRQLDPRQSSNNTLDNSTDSATTGTDALDSLEPIFDATAAAQEASFSVVDITNSTSANDTGGYDLPSLGEALAVTEEIAANQSSIVPGAGSNETVWLPLYDTTETVQLIAGDDGNLYLSGYSNPSISPPAGSLFASDSGIVSGDEQDRAFVYYPHSINRYNVSRIRLVNDPYIPKDSVLITLTLLTINGQGIYAAIDTLGNAFQLVWCNIAPATPDQAFQAKVFLATDSDGGTAVLARPDLRFTVTGGIATDCNPLMLTSAAQGYNTAPSK